MRRLFGLNEKKQRFLMSRIKLSLLFCAGLLCVSFVLCVFVQSAAVKRAHSAVIGTRIAEEGTQPPTDVSPVPAAEEMLAQIREEAGEQDETAGADAETTTTADDRRVIYLTFDDGPGRYTARLLDILKANDVKATFFVTGMHDYADLIAREYKEGHSVGLHSFSHRYSEIYASSEAFWRDYDKIQAIVVEQTGVETKLMRFPGGSSNTMSDVDGIMTRLAREAGERGFTYFDWNVSSGDADNADTAAEVFEQCKSGVEECRTAVVLCHDVKEQTVNAMDDFIRWALDAGYVFKPLTKDSYAAHHKIFN